MRYVIFGGLHYSLKLYCEGPWFTSMQEDGCDKEAHQSYFGTQKNAPVVSDWYQTRQCCGRLCYAGGYLRLGTPVSYKWAQMLDACDCLKHMSIYCDLCVDAVGIICPCFFRHWYPCRRLWSHQEMTTNSQDGTCSAEIRIRIAPAMAAMARLNRIRQSNTTSFATSSSCTSLLSHPSLSTSVKHGPCLLTLKKKGPGFGKQVPEKTFSHLLFGAQDQWLGESNINFFVGPQEPLFDNCKETGTCMVRACHTPEQPLQNHSLGHPGRRATPWSAEEKLDGQHQRADIPAQARTANKGLLQKRLEEDLCWIVPHGPRRPNRSRDWTEQNWT